MTTSSTGDPLFEYACHEGNIGLEGILGGTRELELAADSPVGVVK